MATFKEISAVDALQRVKNENIQVVDIRDENSFETEHVDDSFNLNNENINHFISTSHCDEPLFVICYLGNSSKGVAQYFSQQGYKDVYSVEGGFAAWKIAELNG